MDDYIKREAFLKTWCESYCRPKQNCREDCSFYDAITQFPAADVRENVRGKWIDDETRPMSDPRLTCSNCGSIEVPLVKWRFCPTCGAEMRGEKNGTQT